MRESVEQILAAYQGLGLSARRRGQDWHGPCPVCGGRDRWHVTSDGAGGSIMACRQCGDFRAIAGALGLNGRPPGAIDTAAVERAESERATRHADAARRAVAIFARCRPRRHQYLRGKGFPDLKLPAHEGRIVVPVWGSDRAPVAAVYRPVSQAVPARRADGGRASRDRSVRPPRDAGGTSRGWQPACRCAALSVRSAFRIASSSASRPGGLRIASGTAAAGVMVVDHDWWRCPNKHQWDFASGDWCPYWMRPDRRVDANRSANSPAGPGLAVVAAAGAGRTTRTTTSRPTGPPRWPVRCEG